MGEFFIPSLWNTAWDIKNWYTDFSSIHNRSTTTNTSNNNWKPDNLINLLQRFIYAILWSYMHALCVRRWQLHVVNIAGQNWCSSYLVLYTGRWWRRRLCWRSSSSCPGFEDLAAVGEHSYAWEWRATWHWLGHRIGPGWIVI